MKISREKFVNYINIYIAHTQPVYTKQTQKRLYLRTKRNLVKRSKITVQEKRFQSKKQPNKNT